MEFRPQLTPQLHHLTYHVSGHNKRINKQTNTGNINMNHRNDDRITIQLVYTGNSDNRGNDSGTAATTGNNDNRAWDASVSQAGKFFFSFFFTLLICVQKRNGNYNNPTIATRMAPCTTVASAPLLARWIAGAQWWTTGMQRRHPTPTGSTPTPCHNHHPQALTHYWSIFFHFVSLLLTSV